MLIFTEKKKNHLYYNHFSIIKFPSTIIIMTKQYNKIILL